MGRFPFRNTGVNKLFFSLSSGSFLSSTVLRHFASLTRACAAKARRKAEGPSWRSNIRKGTKRNAPSVAVHVCARRHQPLGGSTKKQPAHPDEKHPLVVRVPILRVVIFQDLAHDKRLEGIRREIPAVRVPHGLEKNSTVTLSFASLALRSDN